MLFSPPPFSPCLFFKMSYFEICHVFPAVMQSALLPRGFSGEEVELDDCGEEIRSRTNY